LIPVFIGVLLLVCSPALGWTNDRASADPCRHPLAPILRSR